MICKTRIVRSLSARSFLQGRVIWTPTRSFNHFESPRPQKNQYARECLFSIAGLPLSGLIIRNLFYASSLALFATAPISSGLVLVFTLALVNISSLNRFSNR